MNSSRRTTRRIGTFAIGAILATQVGAPALAGSHARHAPGWQGQAQDAWIDGRIEASFALNRYLNPFEIDTDVKQGVVRLTGEVESDIDRDLAAEIARGIDGVKDVENDLVVVEGAAKEATSGRDFATRIDDATTTARVKLALLANANTEGLSIDVDAEAGVVSLRGKVASRQASELAERIAANAEGVQEVDNRLDIES